MRRTLFSTLALIPVLLGALHCAPVGAATPAEIRREEALGRFDDWRFGVMMHFNMGTFANKEWSNGDEDPKLFNPAKLDCAQWARACKSAGMKYAILTTKHHDGFCLWDSKTTTHDVGSSPLKRDVVREYMDAFRKEGITPCLYFSIWDRNAGIAEGDFTPEKKKFVFDQLTELLTNYGKVPVLLIDGWCWKPGGHRAIPYAEIREHIRKLQPDCLVSDHTHVQSPWEVDMIYFEGPMGEFPDAGNKAASQLGLTCQHGWFWHPGSEKRLSMNADGIVEKLKLCEARHCNYLVNIGPNRDGLYDDNVVAMLAEIGRKWKPMTDRPPLPPQPAVMMHPYLAACVEASGRGPDRLIDGMSGGPDFNTVWVGDKLPARITLDLGKPVNVGTFSLLPQQFGITPGRLGRSMNPDEAGYVASDKELGDIRSGRIARYRILAGESKETVVVVASGEFEDTRDVKLVAFPPVTARYVTLEILGTRGGKYPVIDEISAGAPN